MTIKKAGLLLFLCGLTVEVTAHSLGDYIPYALHALVTGISAGSDYKLYEDKRGDIKSITAQERVSCAAGGAAALFTDNSALSGNDFFHVVLLT
ncbi:hypothetical protein H0X06_05280 [Candidatus Dependentiae bacterium]|nr:hypothetical protein [Candidatus Dependentiae bacterium]